MNVSLNITDNASINNVAKVVEYIQQTGAIVHFLPPHSPGLNPAQEVFSTQQKRKYVFHI